MNNIEKEIAKKLYCYENPSRIAFSRKYPKFKKPIIFLRQTLRSFENFFNFKIKKKKSEKFFSCVVARHQSVLRRKLGDSSPRLQEQKIINLQQAIKKLNGVKILPNDIFSLWHIIGKPKYKNGYVDGMLLSGGKVIEGIGGGLCQLSNFLYWIFLHAPVEVIERYHHSIDVFPDSGRTLPFGSGATILYNFIDLKIKNIAKYPLQLKIWLTENHLKGQILSSKRIPQKFHIFEQNHFFIKKDNKYFRFNEICRAEKINGKILTLKKITTNFAPVSYTVTNDYLQKNNFQVLEISDP
jgi:vancomycin resistance protein VanW